MLTLLLAAALAVAAGPSRPAAPAPAAVLTGTVTDSAGAPLADVRVHVLELGRGTTTDAEGRFTLPELPSGTLRGRLLPHRLCPARPTGSPSAPRP